MYISCEDLILERLMSKKNLIQSKRPKKAQFCTEHQDIARAMISLLEDAESHFSSLQTELAKMRGEIETPLIITDVQGAIERGELTKLSATWLQRRYKIGYARAAHLLNVLQEKGVVG